MKIFVTKNLSKQQPEQRAQFDQYGRISQDEFKRLTNYLIEGIPCFIGETQIDVSNLQIAPKFGYVMLELKNASQVPQKVRDIMAESKLTFKDALYRYNQSVKEQIEGYIQRRTAFIQNLDVRNSFYRAIQETAIQKGITAFSPCAKTIYEAQANVTWRGLLPDDDDITDAQIEFVKIHAPKFGLEIPKLEWYVATREARQYQYDEQGNPIGHWSIKPGHSWSELDKGARLEKIANFNHHYKSHGYTEEIQRVFSAKPNYFPTATQKAQGRRKDFGSAYHPDMIPEDFMINTDEGTRAQFKEVYKQLQWFMSLSESEQDEFIVDGYTRCPHCHQIVRKVDNGEDVRCELCDGKLEEFSVSSNDHLFYGTDIDQSYSDLDDVNTVVSRDYDDDDDDTYYPV